MIISVLIPPEDRLGPHCETSAWRDAFSAKYVVVRVCRSWYNSCIDRLYQHIHLNRIAQIPRLVRTLEKSGAKDLARFIQRLDLNFFFPIGWERLYCQDFRRLLCLCPSIREMDHTLIFDAKPQLDPVIYATLAVFLDNITYLRLGHDETSFEVQCRLISTLTTLRELDFHPGILDECPEDYTHKFTANLPHLSSLTISLRNGTWESIWYLTLWAIPSIRRLSVTIDSKSWAWVPLQIIQLLPGLCAST
ncbi:hypothetical protein BD410DRAFT_633276 [Rickenella mellea]|uniref:F-box domain-containing protein n=1 Tax=Rickenella mellea TaxID=50990 RepID=A0A4Y7QDF2_9AGAM|nr:hypothetical protein BD410DRAFT_633276 [Rickenella mellea]